MRNLDPLSRRILAVGLAISAVLLSAGFFMLSVNPSVAGAKEQPMTFPFAPDAGGRYMMMPYQDVINDDSGRYIRSENNVLVWDSQSGKSVMYSYYKHGEKGFGWYKLEKQLPANPLK